MPGAAAKPRPVLKVAPARPAAKTPITVSFKAPRIKRSGVYYGARLSVGSMYSPVPCSGLAASLVLNVDLSGKG